MEVIGQTVARYRVLELLGAGGMGVVYKAQDDRLDRQVALKFVSSTLAQDPVALRQFKKEARTASALSHPNICTIYEIDEWDGQPFIAMELLNGETVKQRLEQSKFDVPTLLDIAIQVASALGAAHEKAIIHRDVKPANIFITDSGPVKLLDFGLAKRLPLAEVDDVVTTGFTSAGRILGTASYMSPERLRGHDIDQRSDLFSLGAVIYEMATGRQAFHGASVIEIIETILQQDPAPFDESAGPLPKELRTIVDRLLAKSPDERYQSATALITALRALQQDLAAGQAAMLTSSDRVLTRASIAVLPFRNVGADPEREYFTDGLADELITALTKIERLRVAASASTFTFKGSDVGIREIGARLNVENVLDGSVRWSGNRLRLTCSLTNVAAGYQIWSESYDREMAGVFELQDEMTRSIVEKLKVAWVDRLHPRRPHDLEAYHHCLRGRFYWSKRYQGGLSKAMEEFQAALTRDPEYALAYSGQADVYAFLGLYSLMPPQIAFNRAKEAADKALAFDDTLPEAHTSLGLIALSARWDWPAAEVEFMRAIDLDKTQALAHMYYAWLLALADRRSEAMVAIKRAQDVDPLSPLVNSGAGWMYFLLRDYDQAIAACNACVEVDPNFLVGLYVMAMAYTQKRQYDEAMPLIMRATELAGRAPFYLGLLGQIYAETGRTADVDRVLGELDALSLRQYVPPHCYVYIHASRGDKDQAFAWQEKAVADGAPPFYFMSPAIGRLHDDPRHRAHLARMRAPQRC